jgi:putative peptide maturation dehydrogenase
MKVFRPAHLRLEFRDSADLRLRRAIANSSELSHGRWHATAAHLDHEVELEPGDLRWIEAIPEEGVHAAGDLEAEPALLRLLELGVLLSDDPKHSAAFERDRMVRTQGWWGPAALVQRLGRWDGIDVAAAEAEGGSPDVSKLLEQRGKPPPEEFSIGPGPMRLSSPLPMPSRSAFDELLEARSTCRNFDPGRGVRTVDLATSLHRVFGVQGRVELAPGAVMLKKNSASGGGLHPIEAYLLVQRVEGLESGTYHYHCSKHALEPIQALAAADARSAALELVAGQAWFADAPVLVLMAARFERTFWKYPNHAKAWKVVQLDAGHLSQNLYLSATELGYGAFITAAINDGCAERRFGLDGFGIGAVAVCGFGPRSEGNNVEFDPLGKAVRGLGFEPT